MLKINSQASVVEYNSARVLIASALNLNMNRIDDSKLAISDCPDVYSGWWDMKKYDQKPIAVLVVDQGMFSYTLDLYTGQLRMSNLGEEIVDFYDLLRLITMKVSPDFTPEPSPYLGRGKSMSFLIAQYVKELRKHEEVLREMKIEIID